MLGVGTPFWDVPRPELKPSTIFISKFGQSGGKANHFLAKVILRPGRYGKKKPFATLGRSEGFLGESLTNRGMIG
jgi:hypothetical protein